MAPSTNISKLMKISWTSCIARCRNIIAYATVVQHKDSNAVEKKTATFSRSNKQSRLQQQMFWVHFCWQTSLTSHLCLQIEKWLLFNISIATVNSAIAPAQHQKNRAAGGNSIALGANKTLSGQMHATTCMEPPMAMLKNTINNGDESWSSRQMKHKGDHRIERIKNNKTQMYVTQRCV